MMPVDIIVITFNRIKYLKIFIELLFLSTNYPFRLIVVDNGSTDGTREFILKMKKDGLVWKHLFNEKNMPMAAAFTEGFKLVESELFITVADDITPPLFKKPDWLSVFVKKMQSDGNVGCINFRASRGLFTSFNQRVRPWIEEQIKQRDEEEKYNNLRNLIYGV